MSLYSSYWYRVAGLKLRLRPHVRLFRHHYRGRDWHVLQDPATGRQHRFNQSAYCIIGQLDGNKTVQDVWQTSINLLGDMAPTQDEVIRLLGQLHTNDLLQSDIPPDSQELFERRNRRRHGWRQRFANPFALRIPVMDPDRLLVKWLPAARLLMSRLGLALWLLTVTFGLILATLHWPELTANLSDRLLTPENLFSLWLLYPVIKLLHELGHGFAIRRLGGEVHEAGIILLALAPIPYVEGSASAAFPGKWQRAGAAAAGMAIELFIAAMALVLWVAIEPGQLRAILFNVVVIGSVSTLLFNGNPLLRYDGYYILADLIEIPNLAQRSNRYLGYLAQRYLLGFDTATTPLRSVTAPLCWPHSPSLSAANSWFSGY